MTLVFALALVLQTPTAACSDVASCRAAAEEAAARSDFETFHDLAWRAVQKGRPNDPALMLLVARAQALSGRPGDAIVMLDRLADMHVVVDTAASDWDRIRQMPGWAALEPRLRGATPAAADAPSREAAPVTPAPLPRPSDPTPPRPADTASPAADASLSFDAPAELGPF